MTVLRHALAVLLLPAMATIVVPSWLVGRDGAWPLAAPLALALRGAGVVLVAGGLGLMYRTIALFATVGRGTLAPWDPPRTLVVRGVYRHVRNPMISGVLAILLGEALLFRSTLQLGWFLGFWLLNAVYIPLVEEPMLVSRFGDDYRRYRAQVPRWIPRRTPWSPAGEQAAS